MKEYYAYRIINNKGRSIGKQDFYSSLGKAKCGANHIWYGMLTPDSKIIKIKITEEVVEEFKIKLTKENEYDGIEESNNITNNIIFKDS